MSDKDSSLALFGDKARAWLTQSTGYSSNNLEVTRLKGSTSSAVFLIKILPSQQRFVLRVLNNARWLREEPDLAQHEAAALQEAQNAGLRAPQLIVYAADDASNDAGFGAPVVLMSYIQGEVQLRPQDFQNWLTSLAQTLAAIHQNSAKTFPWQFKSWTIEENLKPPLWSAHPHLWEKAIEIFHGPQPPFHPVFIHRDYHPANVLWQQNAISGVVDWINACHGPAGVDLAHCRTNLAAMYGPEQADQFLDAYLTVSTPSHYHPYWDIDSLLNMCLPTPSFYSPWQEFGLQLIAMEVLQQRMDAHLARVLKRF
jgi:Ser/Thr protein kinase RdoA (MazF antagonist)